MRTSPCLVRDAAVMIRSTAVPARTRRGIDDLDRLVSIEKAIA